MFESIDLTEDWLKGEASKVDDSCALILLQGSAATGFGCIRDNNLHWGLIPSGSKFEPEYSWDLRLFGAKGEWHCVRQGKTWLARFAKRGDWTNFRERRQPLWGTNVALDSDWYILKEARGAEIRLSKMLFGELDNKDLPVRLVFHERIEMQECTGLAGIVDAMLCGLETNKAEEKRDA